MDTLFLGHDTRYWLELQKRVDKLDATDFLQEIADLMAKVSFYESRIKQMSKFLLEA